MLAWLGRFLVETAFGADDGETYPWPFEGVIPNDEWLLHVAVLCSTYERLGPARRSGVLVDPRVRAAVEQVAGAAEPHALAVESWLAQVRRRAPEARARWAAEQRERTVQQVLADLGVHSVEDPGARPNPSLPVLGATDAS